MLSQRRLIGQIIIGSPGPGLRSKSAWLLRRCRQLSLLLEAWFLDGFLGKQHQGHSSAPGAVSRVCTNQALNRAAFLVTCVGFRIRDMIKNIFGKS